MKKEYILLHKIIQFIFGLCTSVLITYCLASTGQSLFVIAELKGTGVIIPFSLGLHIIGHDLYSLTFGGVISLGLNILVGFIIAMPVTTVFNRFLRFPLFFVYPLAGTVVIAVILYTVKVNFNGLNLYAGTRSVAGYLSQLVAGALGGDVFALITIRASSKKL